MVIGAERDTDLTALGRRIRRHVVRMVYDAKSGHIGGSLSAVEIMSVLYCRIMDHDPERPDWPARDRFVMSKGHCTPVQYALLAELGYFPVEELDTFRRLGSRLQGHSVRNPALGVESSAGSLGMGLSFGLGMRLAARLGEGEIPADTPVWVLMGDGEQNEGQVWEAAMAAAHHGVDRLIALIDRNGIQNDDFTRSTMVTEPLDEKYAAFGWDVTSGVDGHDIEAVEAALRHAREVRGQPACVIFDTVKGHGVSFMEHNPGFHGAPPSPDQFEEAMRELADPPAAGGTS